MMRQRRLDYEAGNGGNGNVEVKEPTPSTSHDRSTSNRMIRRRKRVEPRPGKLTSFLDLVAKAARIIDEGSIQKVICMKHRLGRKAIVVVKETCVEIVHCDRMHVESRKTYAGMPSKERRVIMKPHKLGKSYFIDARFTV